MTMLGVSSYDDLVSNSMNILEPSPVDPDGNQREDGMFLPLHIFINFMHSGHLAPKRISLPHYSVICCPKMVKNTACYI